MLLHSHSIASRGPHSPARTVLALSAAALVPCGCTTIWEESFRGKPLPDTEAVAPAEVELREVPWARLSATLTELEAQRAASAVAPQDWPLDRKEQAKAELLSGLQVGAPSNEVRIIGSSRFRTTDRLRADDGDLGRFAGRIGANRVIWSYDYLGKADRIVSEPVTTIGSGGPVWNPAIGDTTWDPWGVNTTTWVPVVYQADEYAWAVFFLRIGAADASMAPG